MTKYSDDGRAWDYTPIGVGLKPAMVSVIDSLAGEENRSRSQMVRVLLEEALNARMRAAKNEGEAK